MRMKEFLDNIPLRSDYETVIKVGTPKDEILALQKETKAKLMVLAPHSHTVIGRFLLGSTTDYLLNHAPCSMYIYIEREPLEI